MYAAERHQLLAQRARRDGRVDVNDVAAELGVAPETIRRDLGVLERQGVVRRVYGGAAAVEAWTLHALDGLLVDVAFLGANGFSAEHGCTTPDMAESAVKAAVVAAARKRVLLADHSKYGTDQLSRFARLAEIDVLVTDS